MSVGPSPESRDPRSQTPPNRPGPVQLPPRVVVELAATRWQRWSHWLAWTGFLLCAAILVAQSFAFRDYFDTTGGIQERFHSGSEYAREKIAIIQVSGIILDGDGYVRQQIERVKKDSNIKGVVVRVDSPGGTVTGSDYIFHHLKQLREDTKLPMVVSMGSIATSGGYYVSMAVGDQEKSIYAEPTTTTGSIGVMIPHYDLSGLLESWNIKDDSLATHPRKLMMSMTRPMSEEDRLILQNYIAQTFERFISIVHHGRPHLRNAEHKLEHEGKDLATGEIFTAEQAKTYGLIDEIGFIEHAVARCAELAGVNKDKVRIVEYPASPTLLSALTGSASLNRRSKPPLLEMLDAATPRAYYLCTTLAPLVTSADAY